MKFGLATCIVVLALSANGGAAALTSVVAPDPLESESERRGGSGAAVATDPAPAQPGVIPAPPRTGRTLGANPLWAVPLSSLRGTRDRPIFSSTRRPPPATVAPAAAPTVAGPAPKPTEPERPRLVLVGTIAGDDGSFGIFLDQSTTSALRLKVGENFQGWRLRSVQGREATLEKDQQLVILNLPEPGAAPPAGQMPLPVNLGSQPIPGQLLPTPQPRRGRSARQL